MQSVQVPWKDDFSDPVSCCTSLVDVTLGGGARWWQRGWSGADGRPGIWMGWVLHELTNFVIQEFFLQPPSVGRVGRLMRRMRKNNSRGKTVPSMVPLAHS